MTIAAKRCVLKESWGVKNLDREGDMIRSLERCGRGRIFGVPSYGTRFLAGTDPNTPYSMDIFHMGDGMEVQELVSQVIWTKGRKLSQAKGPKELFTSILHAIKGVDETSVLVFLLTLSSRSSQHF